MLTWLDCALPPLIKFIGVDTGFGQEYKMPFGTICEGWLFVMDGVMKNALPEHTVAV
jgi:hypothetical protein